MAAARVHQVLPAAGRNPADGVVLRSIDDLLSRSDLEQLRGELAETAKVRRAGTDAAGALPLG